MKKSNLILLSAIGAVFMFSIVFQLRVNRHLRSSGLKKEVILKISEDRILATFSKISVSHGIEVYFTQDSMSQTKVEAPENIISYIKTKVVNDELIIEYPKQRQGRDTVKVFITNNQLQGLNASSGAYVETIGQVSGKDLTLSFSSDTKANLELSFEHVTCKAESGSQITFKGNTSNIEFSN